MTTIARRTHNYVILITSVVASINSQILAEAAGRVEEASLPTLWEVVERNALSIERLSTCRASLSVTEKTASAVQPGSEQGSPRWPKETTVVVLARGNLVREQTIHKSKSVESEGGRDAILRDAIYTPDATMTYHPERFTIVISKTSGRIPYGDGSSLFHRYALAAPGKTLMEKVIELANSGYYPSMCKDKLDELPCLLLAWDFPKQEMALKIWVAPSKGYLVNKWQTFHRGEVETEILMSLKEYQPGVFCFGKAEEKVWRSGNVLASHVIIEVESLTSDTLIAPSEFAMDSFGAPAGTEIQNRALGDLRYLYGGTTAGPMGFQWRYVPKPGENWVALEGTKPPPLTELAEWLQTERRSWEELRGKVVVLDFWAISCKPCVASIPGLVALHDKYADNGLVILGVHYESGGEAMVNFVKERKLPYCFASDTKGVFARHLGISSIPKYFVIDRSGILRVANANHAALENIVQSLLLEGAVPPK